MARRSRLRSRPSRRKSRWWRTWRGRFRLLIAAVAAIPLLYLLAALAGSLIPVNAGWSEPAEGTTIYLADNGVHADIIMPVSAEGLDWAPYFPMGHFAAPPAAPRFIAFGAGERHVYLDTPRWRDIRLSTIWYALTGGSRVIHVEYIDDPGFAVRQIRLRPAEYRRLWAGIRAEFDRDPNGRPQRINHPGYGPNDAFYGGIGKASALRTCNSWSAGELRLAGVRTSLWPPFVQGLVWRYRKADVNR